MKNKTIVWVSIGLFLSFIFFPNGLGTYTDQTTLEIIDVSGSMGGVKVEVKNTGDEIAQGIWIITTVNGGLFGNINIVHECTGCSACGSTLDPGMIKTENTLEAGILLGIGAIEITTSAGATNAEEVSMEKTGFVIGPLAIIG
ncbi:MAG: hypothetical protein R6U21_06525 [Thermoplasmatota archaeon]